jgi:hypothetical protein
LEKKKFTIVEVNVKIGTVEESIEELFHKVFWGKCDAIALDNLGDFIPEIADIIMLLTISI